MHVAALDVPQHPAQSNDFFQVPVSVCLDLVGQRLQVVGAGNRIDGLRHARFIGNDLLGAQRHTRRLLGGECQRLIKRIGVQRLRPTQHCSQRLQSGAHNIVLRLLSGQRGTRGLRVET